MLFEYMRSVARFRDDLYFAADATAAAELGVSRMTIQRGKRELERAGLITRSSHPRFRKTIVYRLPVTQRSSRAGRTRTTSSAPCGRRTGRASASTGSRGRRRRLMEKHPGIINGGVIRKSGETTPATAGDVLAIVCEKFAESGIPLVPRFKAIIGKQAKELLEAGFDAETLVAAAGIALRRSEPQNLQWIASDLVMGRAGVRMTRREYEKALQDEIEIGGLQ